MRYSHPLHEHLRFQLRSVVLKLFYQIGLPGLFSYCGLLTHLRQMGVRSDIRS